ncbi:PEP-CTERM sorting domain-containing protein [Aquabacterium sp.]|uniref:PEP-CTERM sorting domain-containing protein n=1 Tax=Aquabacterium sp. TaxID=1872578 RepID=UPI002E301942|nr:PEP-CTERM sorting domain-containing protein [Aquabacterium sp.]HEX5310682.1 PEP-CTERM sorting domain-containing protein [Aquabacterium sp.]
MRQHAIWAALGLAAVAPMGHAASNASAGLSDFHFQLEDLNQFDGVAASFNWLSGNGSGLTALSASALDDTSDGSASKKKSQSFFQYSVQGASDHAQASSLISLPVGNWSLNAQGLANGGNSNFAASALTGQGGNVSLAAHSRLTITAKASVLAAAADPGGNGSDWAKALASLGLSYSYGTDNGAINYSFVDSLTATATAGGYYDYLLNAATGQMEVVWVSGASAQDARDRELKVVFENTSNATQLATLTLLTKVSGVGAAAVTAPVPEPASAAFALVGVACLGGWARRQRKA